MNKTNHEFIRNYELETWTRCSDNYEDTFAMLTNKMISPLMKVTEIKSGSRILDIGCGPGNSTNILSETGAKVTGIDFSQKMIDNATISYPKINFKQADAESIPEEDNTFDVVIANYVVHHLPDPEKVFSEIARVLKPNGKFAFAVWGPKVEQSSIGAFVKAVSSHHELSDLPHGPLYGVTDYEVFNSLIEKAGLSDFKISTHKTEWKCKTLVPVMDGLWTWGNLGAFPQEKQNKIKSSMRENCRPFANESGFNFPHSAILGWALKK